MGDTPRDGKPIQLKSTIAITFFILKIVAASTTEAVLSALVVNNKDAHLIFLILVKLDHAQPRTPVFIDNAKASGIVYNITKRQRSHSMEIRCVWLLDEATHKYFKFHHHPGAELLADYPTKAHIDPIHICLRPYYLHMKDSPTCLIRTAKPSTQRRCTLILGDPYTKGIPSTRIP